MTHKRPTFLLNLSTTFFLSSFLVTSHFFTFHCTDHSFKMIYLLFLQLVTTFLSSKLTHNRNVYGVHDIKWYRRISYNPPTPPPQVYFQTSADYADDYYLRSTSNITITKQSPFLLVNLFLSFSPTSFTALRRYHCGLSRRLSRPVIIALQVILAMGPPALTLILVI